MMNKKSVIKEESYRNFKNLSHELKTPVANLNLVLETLYEYDKTISIDKKRDSSAWFIRNKEVTRFNILFFKN